MSLLIRCLRELYDLFVDDGAFAALVVLWVTASSWLLPRLALGPWSGPILFGGLAILFAGGLLRSVAKAR